MKSLTLLLLFTFSHTIFPVPDSQTLAPVINNEQFDKQWLVDTSHSNIGFTVKHLFTPVRGSFGEYSSEIWFNPDNLAESRVSMEIQVASISTGNERRDNDLRSANFFNAEQWPTITFESSSITHEGGQRYAMTGSLTIKDVTREVTLPFTLLGMSEHYRMEGYDMAGISASTVVSRTDYGVGTGDWVRTNIVADEVTVDIQLELAHKREN